MNQQYSIIMKQIPRSIRGLGQQRQLLSSQPKSTCGFSSSSSSNDSLFHSTRKQYRQYQQSILTSTTLAKRIPLKVSLSHNLCTSSKCLFTPPRQNTQSLSQFSQFQSQPSQFQQRTFSSNNRRGGGGGRGLGRGGRGPAQNRKGRGNNNSKQGQPMINEHLIRMLLQTSSKTADRLQVRLIVDRPRKNLGSDSEMEEEDNDDNDYDHDDDVEDDNDDVVDANDQPNNNNNKNDNAPNNDQTSKSKQNPHERKSDVQLVSLSQAISISTDLGVDLVGITLQQTIPVIRAIDYSKFLYEQQSSKTKGGKNKKKNNQKNKSNKEFTFRAGIDPHDLQRKTKNMLSYLEKGYSCQIVITSNRRNLMSDKDIVVTTLDRIQEYIGENANPGKLKINPQGNRGSILFQPKSKK